MKTKDQKSIEVTKKNGSRSIIYRVDIFIFIVLLLFLGFLVFSSGRANIQSDSIDYYAILQRLSFDEERPIARNLYFVDQRSPGYSILCMPSYYFVSITIEPFVKTEKIVTLDEREHTSPTTKGSEKIILPQKPLRFKDIFFKDFYIKEEGSWFKWKNISAMLFTSYLMLFIGIVFIVKTLSLEGEKIIGASLIMLVILTSTIFMHNIINIPAYATLAAFGASSVFCYFFTKSFLKEKSRDQFLAGLAIGLLILIRLELGLFFVVSLLCLISKKNKQFLKNYIMGFAVMMLILPFYNLFMFGNPLHYGILKGDINIISLDLSYIYANLLNPSSGIFFWSPLISVGVIGLFLSSKKYHRIFGVCCIALIGLYLLKIPAMYYCVGEGTIPIGGLLISCPNDMSEALILVRSDINRYITVLVPFSLLGLRNLIYCAGDRIKFCLVNPLVEKH